MNYPPVYQRLNPPTGPSAMILPAVILRPMGLLLLAGGLGALQRQQPMGVVYCAGGVLILSFLCFSFALHIRAQRAWAWHLRTERVPQFRARLREGRVAGRLCGPRLGPGVRVGRCGPCRAPAVGGLGGGSLLLGLPLWRRRHRGARRFAGLGEAGVGPHVCSARRSVRPLPLPSALPSPERSSRSGFDL